MSAFGCTAGRFTSKKRIPTSCVMLLLLVVLVSDAVVAFTALSTSITISLSRDRVHKLYGKNRIQRIAATDDHEEDIVAPIIKTEEDSAVEIQVPSMSLEELLLPSPKCDVNQVGPTALAYIGDVVFELLVRARHVWPTRRTSDLQKQVVALVRGMCCCELDANTSLH